MHGKTHPKCEQHPSLGPCRERAEHESAHMYALVVVVLREGRDYVALAGNSLYGPDWPPAHRNPPVLCLSSAGIKVMHPPALDYRYDELL